MSAYSRIAFGTCHLDLQTRELRRDGMLQAVAPKVFDLIALLVERHPRVVTKDELLNVLWPHQVVSDGAIARAVVQARKAVGDAAFIKTVHSVGYRFVGDLTPQGTASVQAAVPDKTLRIGFLPIDNRTGDRQLDWIQLGLAALAIQSLESGARFEMASLPEILLTLAPLPANPSVGVRVEAATRLLGLDGCVHATLRRQGVQLWLDYQGLGAPLEVLTGSLCGDDPGELVQRMANDILASMKMGDGLPTALVSKDQFINQAFARAAQMVAIHQFRAATKLLEVVIEFEPLSLPARLAHLRSHVGTDAVRRRPCIRPRRLTSWQNGPAGWCLRPNSFRRPLR
jgi:DNA-binding winged helix-turn-helix (wHTH) protein